MSKGLPPLNKPGLKVVFVGTEPGAESLRTKSYYATSRNSFWSDLHAAGCTATMLAPADVRRALGFGIGLDDVYGDPAAFRRRILEAAPRAVCFNSKAALARVAGDDVSPPSSGAEASRWVRFPGGTGLGPPRQFANGLHLLGTPARRLAGALAAYRAAWRLR
jgi:TDG/mug DNA glycosylase family protein